MFNGCTWASGPGRVGSGGGEWPHTVAWQIYILGSVAQLSGPVRISTFQKRGGDEGTENRAPAGAPCDSTSSCNRGRRHQHPHFPEPPVTVPRMFP